MVSSRSEGYPKPFPNREDTLTLASIPVPLLDSTTQVCWKSDNPSPPDTTLTPPGTQYGAIPGKAQKRKRLKYAGFAPASNARQRRSADYESEGRRFESCRARPKKPRKPRGFRFAHIGDMGR